ncbi:hypothetical protein L916_14665 [Phytophthora nicotianae]|uniref:Uncharacterized protein n=1 Tax=Phytophthora nicotianae TaxID=4792 RepID=W2IEW4_PHYNI|nr:hypothetical protein L916_14665 [Phytophthora nicotianae]
MLDAPPSNNVAKCLSITSNSSSNSGKSLVRAPAWTTCGKWGYYSGC